LNHSTSAQSNRLPETDECNPTSELIAEASIPGCGVALAR
jgi:hypothetical protein